MFDELVVVQPEGMSNDSSNCSQRMSPAEQGSETPPPLELLELEEELLLDEELLLEGGVVFPPSPPQAKSVADISITSAAENWLLRRQKEERAFLVKASIFGVPVVLYVIVYYVVKVTRKMQGVSSG